MSRAGRRRPFPHGPGPHLPAAIGHSRLAGLRLLVAKLAWEAWWRPRTGGGIPVAIEAHRFGALAGLLFAMIGPGKRNRRKRADPQQPRD